MKYTGWHLLPNCVIMRSTPAEAILSKRNGNKTKIYVFNMSDSLFYTIFDTSAGWTGILGSKHGLRRITLPQTSEQRVRQLMGDAIDEAIWSPPFFQDLMERLKAYFSGHEVAFSDKLDLSEATSFQREVWEATRLIPHGETRSYAWVAGQMGRPEAVRAVGQALTRNPLPVIVPCHRVVGRDGRLGGYRGGIELKRRLLQLEDLGSNDKSNTVK